VDDGRNQQLQVDSWSKKLFAIGLAGILVAILLPSYLLGAGVLVASCVAPFWQYARWRNEQVSDQTSRLRWSHLLRIPDTSIRPVGDVELELPSGLADLPASGKIAFVGKSFGERITRARTSEAGKSSGFETALALIGHAVSRRATDLHLGAKDDKVVVRLRIDGEIVTLEPLPTKMGLSVVNVFKVLSDLSIADKRRSQDGSFRAEMDGRRLCFRVSSQGTNTGEKLSIRILDPSERFSSFSPLGLNDRLQEQLKAILSRKSGLILFAGATGAGKSTTAYASLRHLDSGERNIITIEDPIEYSIPSIDQIEVRTRAGQTFESGLRSLLRQDADIVLVGEIRDEETAKIAVRAAMAGQLVLSTLHATDSTSAVLRMADLGVDSYNIAAALRAVVGQRLVRRLCTQCRIVYEPDEQMLRRLGLSGFQGELYQRPDPLSNPCLDCNGRGFLGRTGVFELLEVTLPIRDLIRDRAGIAAVTSAARKQGMTRLWDDGLRLVRDGVISPQEFLLTVDGS
jgi:type II secretory ATPase GspE/PulE/Tfp pilus assembly ATPase PilB-like protein